jgi:SMC interacting uncharacterized protein involved in chromosome segregation
LTDEYTRALQQLQEQIRKQEIKIEQLQSKMNELKSLLAQLKLKPTVA